MLVNIMVGSQAWPLCMDQELEVWIHGVILDRKLNDYDLNSKIAI